MKVWILILLATVVVGAQSPLTPLKPEGAMPSLNGAVTWLNSPSLKASSLRGKVVLVDFWAYSCINCLRSLPYLSAWADKYKDQGLVVIGVHSPSFAFERDTGNVKQAVERLKITFPVAVDSNDVIWKAFHNQYWPGDYLVDAQGQIRYHHFGEGAYAETERAIQALLSEARHQGMSAADPLVEVTGTGAEAPAAFAEIGSPETFIGSEGARHFDSPQALQPDKSVRYDPPPRPQLNQWGLGGEWKAGDFSSEMVKPGGTIVFRFHARDLHLVLGSASGKPIRFRVTIDGAAPGADHGVDTDAQGNGTVTAYRLYQLIRQAGPVETHTFTIEFLDPGLKAYNFTFG